MQIRFHGEEFPFSREINISQGESKSHWHIPEEVPVAFVYNRRNYSVMMATPDDLVDFAIGFSLTENIIDDYSQILSLDIYLSEQGVDLRFKISSAALEKLDLTQRRRHIVGSASCGLCGLENADVLFKKLPKVAAQPVNLDMDVVVASLTRFRIFNHLTN